MMSSLDLLLAARQAGVTLSRDGDRIIARGPKSAGPIVEQILARKNEVLPSLPKRKAPGPCGYSNQPCGQPARLYMCGWRCTEHQPANYRKASR